MEHQLNETFTALRRAYIEAQFGKLNDRQKEAVFAGAGPLLLLAGAGSGKTTVLVNRIANLIRFGDAYKSDKVFGIVTPEDITELQTLLTYGGQPSERMKDLLRVNGVAPYHILAITFTNKAAGELKNRLETMLGEEGRDILASTFHSACVRILRREGDRLGYPPAFTIYDTDDSQRAMKEVYQALNVDDKFVPLKASLNNISRMKDQMISPEDAASSQGDVRSQLLAKIYAAYEKRLRQAGAMDFDDLIYQTVRLFEEFPDALAVYQKKFQYILVDEYQDTSHAQFRFVELLGSTHRQVCVVGDDDQSIYRFRGATIENILNFESEFPGAQTIRLEQNYRSTSNILNAANSVIENNEGRKGKTLWTQNDEGAKVIHFEAENETEEAQHVAQSIARHVSEGARLRDCAVLYRMNAQSGPVENYFVRAGLPYKIIGGHKFYDRKEVRDMLAYLTILANPKDDLRLKRIINEPGRKIGSTTLEAVASLAAEKEQPMLEIVRHVEDYPKLGRAAKAIAAFRAVYDALEQAYREAPLTELLSRVAELSGYQAMLEGQGEEGKTRMENIGQLMTAIKTYANEQGTDATLEGFLEETALITDMDSYDENADVVVMMTLHAAKGLEYPYVYIIGLEDGIFPSDMSRFSKEDLEEERRLCYVGITRAKKELQLCSAASRMLFGQTRYNKPSCFLSEIRPDCIEEQESEIRRKMKDIRNEYDYDGEPENESDTENEHEETEESGETPRRGRSGEGEFSIRSAYERENRRSGNGFAPSSSFASRSSLMSEAGLAKDKTEKNESAKAAGKKFAVGDKVQHKIFGEGTVVNVTPVAGDVLVEVQFAAATKKMMANYAPLTKL